LKLYPETQETEKKQSLETEQKQRAQGNGSISLYLQSIAADFSVL
jgi:hypothetical protein